VDEASGPEPEAPSDVALPSNVCPVEPGSICVDGTMLVSLAECSTKSSLRYVYDWVAQREKWPATAGIAFHKACELHFRGAPADAVNATFAALYQPPPGIFHDDGKRLEATNLQRIVARWVEKNPLSTFPFQVESTEQPFRVPLGKLKDGTPVYYMGRQDLILREGRFLRVADIKTTRSISPYWKDQWMTSAQLTGYVWADLNGALPSHLLGSSVIGATIVAVEFREIPSSNRRCSDHGMPYAECGILHCKHEIIHTSRVPDQLNEWRLGALHLAERYASILRRFPTIESLHRLRMQGQWNGACRFCEFKEFCMTGRQLPLVSSLLTPERWVPFPGAR